MTEPAARLQPVPNAGEWQLAGRQWASHLDAEGKQPTTLEAYNKSLKRLAAWALGQGLGSPQDITKQHLEQFFGWSLHRTTARGVQAAPAGVAKDFRHLRVFFRWLATLDDENGISVMHGMKEPHVPEQPVPVLDDDELRALLKACRGTGFTERRDAAIIRLFFDTGIRISEMAGIKQSKINWDDQLIMVLGKGGRERPVRFSSKTAEALYAYLRARAKHKDRRLDALWLAGHPHRGAVGTDGIRQMLTRRAEVAGVEGIHAHRFRHTAASNYIWQGGQEGNAMELFGWKTRSMLDRYGRSARQRRALDEAKRLAIGDRI